jgi:thymidylate synthase
MTTDSKTDAGSINECPYHALLAQILREREHEPVRPDRTETGTLSTFGGMLKFDLRNEIVPFVTTKKLHYNSVILELLSFLRGETDASKIGSKIWDANTSREFLDSRGLTDYEVGDMGPMYGHNLRNFGAPYRGCKEAALQKEKTGFDQIENLIEGIRKDPYSRRHVITTFDPSNVSRSVLMPCHGIAIQFYVKKEQERSTLSCSVYCRSSDAFLGLPFNIASYAILTYIIAEKASCGLVPGDLIVYLGDAHIYRNHVDAVKEQLSRTVLPYPKLKVNPEIKTKDWSEITLDDFTVVDYVSHPAIKASMAI